MAPGVRLIIFGRQGAGKGTQCQRLATHYGVPHVSTGDMLRAAVGAGTEFGLKARTYMDAGKLLPDDIMVGLVAERLAQPDAVAGWLLDGFPRTLGQAAALHEVTADAPAEKAVNLEVPESVVFERITKRRVCSGACQSIYRVGDPSAESGVCVRCGGAVVQRGDDTEESVRKRLSDYQDQTVPVVTWFAEQGRLVEVDGDQPADDVFAALVSAIDSR